LWRSTIVTFAFTAAAMYAETRPAGPAPITTMLRRTEPGGPLRVDLASLEGVEDPLGDEREDPRITKAAMSPAEILNCPSCVPAYTYAIVPASMPTWLTQK
jgi:hypothetical protein